MFQTHYCGANISLSYKSSIPTALLKKKAVNMIGESPCMDNIIRRIT